MKFRFDTATTESWGKQVWIALDVSDTTWYLGLREKMDFSIFAKRYSANLFLETVFFGPLYFARVVVPTEEDINHG